MTANATSFHQNFTPEKKSADIVEKDIRKWVESVCEFKANLDKQKSEPPLEKHFKKIKKLKIKKKPSLVAVPIAGQKNTAPGQRKGLKSKKVIKKLNQGSPEKSPKKDQTQPADAFEQLKESYKSLKLPQNWTSGLSNGRIVFNRIRVTAYNAQQKVAVERSLVITKDCNVHVLLNGSEITLNNWEMQKIDSVDDVKRAIKDVDAFKVCDGPQSGSKSPQYSMFVDSKIKTCTACKSETTNPQKVTVKKPRAKKQPPKGVTKQKSFQK